LAASLISRISWLFSAYHIRAFASTLGLGVVITLLFLSQITGLDPLAQVKTNRDLLNFISTGGCVAVLFLSFLALGKRTFKDVILFLLAGCLFTEFLGLQPSVVAFIGHIPRYLQASVLFFLIAFISFVQLASRPPTSTKNHGDKPAFLTQQQSNQDEKKNKKNKKKNGTVHDK